MAIRAPHNSGATFYDYKGLFSINLIAVVDRKRRFIYVDVGTEGQVADGVFRSTSSHFIPSDHSNDTYCHANDVC